MKTKKNLPITDYRHKYSKDTPPWKSRKDIPGTEWTHQKPEQTCWLCQLRMVTAATEDSEYKCSRGPGAPLQWEPPKFKDKESPQTAVAAKTMKKTKAANKTRSWSMKCNWTLPK